MAKATIVVSPSTVSLQVGQTATLVASLANGVIIGATWSSSNKTLVHVNRDTGLVTALAAGTVTITATYRGSSSTCRATALAAPVTDLTITCPGNQTVTGTGALTVVKLGPIQTSGGVAPIVVTFQPPVGTGFPIGTTVVTATATSADLQRATCQYSVTVTGSFPPPPGPLVITCPVPVIAYSPDGNPMAVTFAATTTGGTAPITITYSPASGSTFALGTTGVVATAVSTDGQTSICSFSVTVKDTADSTPRGPQASITCLVGSVRILPGQSIQAAINASPAGTKFCLAAGTHTISASITPKSGNSFIGEYGAIIDGTGWVSNDATQAAFRAHNQDINDVTIRNLVIQNMPQFAIRSSTPFTVPNFSTAHADGWVVSNNEIKDNLWGVLPSNNGIVINNYIHDNYNHDLGFDYQASGQEAFWGGGIHAVLATDVLVENNEFYHNGSNQRVFYTHNFIFRNNYVHDNAYNGMWFDGENDAATIANNLIEDHPGNGIMYEVSGSGTITDNIIRRSDVAGILISCSHNVEVSGNIVEDCAQAISLIVNIAIIGTPSGGKEAFAMQNVSVHDNTVSIRTAGGSYGALLNPFNGDATPYTNGSKNLTWTHNAYTHSVSTTGAYFYWAGTTKTFTQWQAIPQDATGTIA